MVICPQVSLVLRTRDIPEINNQKQISLTGFCSSFCLITEGGRYPEIIFYFIVFYYVIVSPPEKVKKQKRYVFVSGRDTLV